MSRFSTRKITNIQKSIENKNTGFMWFLSMEILLTVYQTQISYI